MGRRHKNPNFVDFHLTVCILNSGKGGVGQKNPTYRGSHMWKPPFVEVHLHRPADERRPLSLTPSFDRNPARARLPRQDFTCGKDDRHRNCRISVSSMIQTSFKLMCKVVLHIQWSRRPLKCIWEPRFFGSGVSAGLQGNFPPVFNRK